MKIKTKYHEKAYLNNRQKKWFVNFQKQYPTAELAEIYKGLSGDRIVRITWTEKLPKIIVSECEDCGLGVIHHQATVKLRIFGDPRGTAKYSYTISHRSCSLEVRKLVQAINRIANNKNYCSGEGQLSLPIPTILEVPVPTNPIIVKNKFSANKKTPKVRYNIKQLKLFEGVSLSNCPCRFSSPV